MESPNTNRRGPPDGADSSDLKLTFVEHRTKLLRFLRARSLDNPDDLLDELWNKVVVLVVRPIANPLSCLYRMANDLVRERLVARMILDAERHDLLSDSL